MRFCYLLSVMGLHVLSLLSTMYSITSGNVSPGDASNTLYCISDTELLSIDYITRQFYLDNLVFYSKTFLLKVQILS